MIAQAEMIFRHTEREKPVLAERTPVGKPFKIRSRLTEKFKLHLLKFANAENKVSGGYFVTERFTYLSDTERKLFAGRALNICEVDKYTLRRFGTKIDGVFCVLRNALKRFEHKIELTDVCKIVFAA